MKVKTTAVFSQRLRCSKCINVAIIGIAFALTGCSSDSQQQNLESDYTVKLQPLIEDWENYATKLLKDQTAALKGGQSELDHLSSDITTYTPNMQEDVLKINAIQAPTDSQSQYVHNELICEYNLVVHAYERMNDDIKNLDSGGYSEESDIIINSIDSINKVEAIVMPTQ